MYTRSLIRVAFVSCGCDDGADDGGGGGSGAGGGKAALLVSSLCSVEPGGVQSSCHDVNR